MSSSNSEGLGGEGWLCQADRVGSVFGEVEEKPRKPVKRVFKGAR